SPALRTSDDTRATPVLPDDDPVELGPREHSLDDAAGSLEHALRQRAGYVVTGAPGAPGREIDLGNAPGARGLVPASHAEVAVAVFVLGKHVRGLARSALRVCVADVLGGGQHALAIDEDEEVTSEAARGRQQLVQSER